MTPAHAQGLQPLGLFSLPCHNRPMHRPSVGIIAVALIAIGAYFELTSAEGDHMVAYACWRVGGVMALLWLAQPQLVRVPRWLLAIILCVLLLVMWRPKILWAALPAFFLLWLLRPRDPGMRRG